MTFFKRHHRSTTVVVLVTMIGIAIWLAASPGSAPAKRKPKAEITIKFATLAPEGSTWMKIMHDFDEELRERTENRLGFKFYPGGVK